MTTATMVPIAEIDTTIQTRADTSEETAQRYAEAIASGHDLPPIVVYQDGNAGPYVLADGHHRLRAHVLLGRTEVACRVLAGTKRDAVLHAAGSNVEHGLPRTRKDVDRSIETLLRDPEWSKKSDRWIADIVDCDHKTVAARRRDWGIPQCESVEGRDGRGQKKRAPKPKPLHVEAKPTSIREEHATLIRDLDAKYGPPRTALIAERVPFETTVNVEPEPLRAVEYVLPRPDWEELRQAIAEVLDAYQVEIALTGRKAAALRDLRDAFQKALWGFR